MTRIFTILTVFLLTSFDFVGQNEKTDQNFEVKISYIGLPYPVTTNYLIDNEIIIVYKTKYESKKDKVVEFDKYSFKMYDSRTLFDFLTKTDWDTIPKKLVMPTLDGYQFSIDIKINSNKFHFDIDNTYHLTIDSLITICNDLIPNKRKRKEYYLPYSEWEE